MKKRFVIYKCTALRVYSKSRKSENDAMLINVKRELSHLLKPLKLTVKSSGLFRISNLISYGKCGYISIKFQNVEMTKNIHKRLSTWLNLKNDDDIAIKLAVLRTAQWYIREQIRRVS